jgi:hypothetical protein
LSVFNVNAFGPKSNTKNKRNEERRKIMNKIILLIQGSPRRQVEFQEGDSLADLVRNLRDDASLKLDKIQRFHADGDVVENPSTLQLRPGMLISGAPKLEGGSR